MKRSFVLLLTLLAIGFAAPTTSAQTLYWDTNGATAGTSTTSTANWNGTTDWTTDSTGSSTTIGYVSGDTVVFSAGTNGTGAQAVTVNGSASAAGITINNGVLTLSGSSTPSLSIGSGGLTINSNDGATNIANSLPIVIAASQSWANNSTQNFTDAGNISGTSVTLTFNGTGSGTDTLSGVLSGTMNLIQGSANSPLILTNTSNAFTGTITANAGMIEFGGAGSLGNSSNAIDLNNGATLAFTVNNTTLAQNIVLGTGGGSISAGVGGGIDSFFTGTVTGGTGLNIIHGDFLPNTTNVSNAGTINIMNSGTRLLAFQAGIFGNNAVVNVGAGTILDFQLTTTLGNQINLTDTSTLAARSQNVALSNVVFPTSGTVTLGSDDIGNGSIKITNNIALTTGNTLTLDINAHSATAVTPVTLTGIISGGGALVLNPGTSFSSLLTLGGANTYSGPTTINNLTVAAGVSGNIFGSSTVTLNNSTFDLGGGYNVTDTANQFVLGTGTNLFAGAVGGISSFTGSVINGAGSVLHLTGSNNVMNPGSGAVSNYSTLDLDNGRTFLLGSTALNFIANNTTVNVAGGGIFDIATGTTATVANTINFVSGTGIAMRTNNTKITLSNANLPTAGTFYAGSDDVNTTTGGSFTLTKGVALTGDLTWAISGASSVPVTMQGVISGTGGVIEAAGTNGTGNLFLKGTNTYSGATTVNAGTLTIIGNNTGAGNSYNASGGTLQIGTGGSISNSAAVTLGSSTTSGTLALGDSTGAVSQTVASLMTSGTGTTNAVVGGGSASVSTLTVNNTSAIGFAGVIGGTSSNQNAVAVVKTGSGTLTLSGTNTYTGGTTISAGRLAVDGSIAGNAAVAATAEVGGHGKIAGTISGAGAVGPGNSPGILSASAVNPTGGTSFNFEFTLAGGPTYSNASASGNDVLHLEGGTPFTSILTSANVINLYFAAPNVTYQGGFFINGSPSTLAADLAAATFNYYMEDDAHGTVTYNGVKYDLTRGTQSTIAVTNAAFADGITNGAVEIFTAPEPSTYGLMLLGTAGLFFLNRRVGRKS